MRIQTIEMYKRQSIDKQRLTKSHPFILSHALPGIVHLKISQRILVVIQLPIHTLERTTLYINHATIQANKPNAFHTSTVYILILYRTI